MQKTWLDAKGHLESLPRRRKIRYINFQLPCDSRMNSTAGYATDAARLAPRNSPSATNHSGLGLGAPCFARRFRSALESACQGSEEAARGLCVCRG
jgi:hypothetical protein